MNWFPWLEDEQNENAEWLAFVLAIACGLLYIWTTLGFVVDANDLGI